MFGYPRRGHAHVGDRCALLLGAHGLVNVSWLEPKPMPQGPLPPSVYCWFNRAWRSADGCDYPCRCRLGARNGPARRAWRHLPAILGSQSAWRLVRYEFITERSCELTLQRLPLFPTGGGAVVLRIGLEAIGLSCIACNGCNGFPGGGRGKVP